MGSKELLIRQWVPLFNNGDNKALSDLYSDNTINHQVPNKPVEGKQAIRKMFREKFQQAKMTCIIENFFEYGKWIILEWKDPHDLRECGFFQINEDKIQLKRGYWDKLSFLR